MAIVTRVTPAVCTITEKIPLALLRQKWKGIIVPILQDEEMIYSRIFESFVLIRHRGGNEGAGREMFRNDWELENKIVDEKVLNASFDAYWGLAGKPQYWTQKHQLGGQLSYQSMLTEWEGNSQDLIQRCARFLQNV